MANTVAVFNPENNTDSHGPLYLAGAGAMDGQIRSRKQDRRYIYDQFGTSPGLSASAPETGAAVGSTTDRVVSSAHHSWRVSPCGTTQTLLAPFKSTTVGWDISHDLTNNDIVEFYASGGISTDCKSSFIVGTDAFFFRCKLKIHDVSGTDNLMIGFRKQEASNGTFTSYNEYAAIGNISGNIKIQTQKAGGGNTITDTTQTWADDGTHTVGVYVSSAGVVTFTVDDVAPTATVAMTMTSGIQVVPFLYLIHDTDVADGTLLQLWESGIQLPTTI